MHIAEKRRRYIWLKNTLPNYTIIFSLALFVQAKMFSRKWDIFQKLFSVKLSYFSIFDNNLK